MNGGFDSVVVHAINWPWRVDRNNYTFQNCDHAPDFQTSDRIGDPIYINSGGTLRFAWSPLVGVRITRRDRLTRNFKKGADTIDDRHRDKLHHRFTTANIFYSTGQF